MYNFDKDSEQVSVGDTSEPAKYRGTHSIVAKDRPCLSKSTLTIILMLFNSMTERVLGPY
jgi:hypothetical protein